MNILIVRGGWDGHGPVQTSDRVASALRDLGATVEISDAIDRFLDADHLKSLDLIVPMRTMDRTATRDHTRPILAALRAGVGIGGWHGGMCDAFREDTE